ncbi:CPBP family intramembrane metalloprotease [Komagataeibacter oboediens]|uniref:CPBP family intramembrane glutamic endopeptidase n=1 Tax=Komagataeibacter oboediens TaxID=65958 RepID=UPI0023DB60C8|nr:CPBP family intramembrane glutamic endopeptidase [Komagataeibacter oboediens]WEQ51531.1 CPBP family intramembrane metalloprotease [Komagataeibacter oboediens]
MRSIFSASGSGGRGVAVRNLVLYLLIAFAGGIMVSSISRFLFHGSLLALAHRGLTGQIMRALLLLLGFVALPTVVLLKLNREPYTYSGWNTDGWPIYAVHGFLSGALLMGGIAIIIGPPRISHMVHQPATVWPDIVLSLLLWGILALGEEGLNRGYAFVQMARALSFWPATLLGSAVFAAEHLPNPGESLMGVINAGLLGSVLSYVLYRTGSLWFSVSFHASWNFFQTSVFGLANSGSATGTGLLHVIPTGPRWLTGGSTGPEASVLVIPACLILTGLIRGITAGRPHDQMDT